MNVENINRFKLPQQRSKDQYSRTLEACVLGNKEYSPSTPSAKAMMRRIISRRGSSNTGTLGRKKYGYKEISHLSAPGFSHKLEDRAMDWGSNGSLVIGLENHLYLWNNGDIQLGETNVPERVTCVKFSGGRGKYLAAAFENRGVRLYQHHDSNSVTIAREAAGMPGSPMYGVRQNLKFMCEIRATGVSTMSWNGPYLILGYTSGKIEVHDTRKKPSLVGTLGNANGGVCHSAAITKLSWSVDDSHLAAMDAEGTLSIWNHVLSSAGFIGGKAGPKHLISFKEKNKEYQTVVCRTMEWCQDKKNFGSLAIGLTDEEGTIHIINAVNGVQEQQIITGNPIMEVKYVECFDIPVLMAGFYESGTENGGLLFINPQDGNIMWKKDAVGVPLAMELSSNGQTVAMVSTEGLCFWCLIQEDVTAAPVKRRLSKTPATSVSRFTLPMNMLR